MKPPLAQFLNLVFLFVILSLTSLSFTSCGGDRRILHQPLFPVESTPPPEPPPPPPPPLDTPDEPFFPETPTNGITQPQIQSPPNNNISTSNPVPIATQPTTTQTKKVAIAISVGIVTLGMLSALAFFLYRHRANHQPTESQKLVGNEGGAQNAPNTTTTNNNNPTNSDILYLGTMEPSNPVTVSEENGSPYHKLTSIRSSERYRPSPELQPLPPLSRPPPIPPSYDPPFSKTSPSVMSSEDAFYSPQLSTTSNGEGSYSPVPKQIFADSGTTLVKSVVTHSNSSNSNPHSRRSSPKSRLSFSSPPDVKQVIVPPPSSPPPPPPPLPPKSARIPTPPPPPPPPLPPPSLVAARKQLGSKTGVPPMPIQLIPRSQTNTSIPKATIRAELKAPVVETTRGGSSSEPPRNEVDEVDGTKPKLKPLHWDKVRATSDRAMVWDQFKSNSFHLNEDMIETLFGCNSQNQPKKESSRRSVLPPVEQENRVLDPKKSQNIAILLRALNVTRDEVSEALLDGNPDGLGAELLETLVKMAPTKEEELKLRDYNGDVTKLGSAERFLKAVLDIPFAFRRVDAMLYRANFDIEVKYLRKSFDTLEAACEELKNSRLFLKLLEAVLRTGNRMNVGTNRGDARAFKLDTLLKLVDIKGVDGKTTLLHFVVQEMIRSEGAGTDNTSEDDPNNLHQNVKDGDIQKQGLRVVAGLGRELGNVKKAAGMDSDVLRSYLSKLEMGLEKVRLVLQYEKSNTKGKFFEAMHLFLEEAEKEIISIKTDEKKSLFHVKEVTAYFHGDTAKEEAHPFRIFMVVRDFLGVLDQVCKEVGKIHERTVVGSARSFRISSSASLPVLNRYNIRHEASSDEDSSSP